MIDSRTKSFLVAAGIDPETLRAELSYMVALYCKGVRVTQEVQVLWDEQGGHAEFKALLLGSINMTVVDEWVITQGGKRISWQPMGEAIVMDGDLIKLKELHLS